MGAFGIWQWIVILILTFLNFPAYYALPKIGKSKWGFILLGIPLIGTIYLALIAFSKWDNTDQKGRVILINDDPKSN